MNPVATTFFFYFLAIMAIVSAIAVITRKNAVHAALSLIVTLVSLAGLYLMLYAPFVAGVQIVLYAGGIMVLFLFVIMLVNLDQNIREIQFNKQWMVGLIAALSLGGLLLFVIRKGRAIFPITRVRCCRKDRTRSRSGWRCTASTCCRSRLRRCCCWWPSWARWSWRRRGSEKQWLVASG